MFCQIVPFIEKVINRYVFVMCAYNLAVNHFIRIQRMKKPKMESFAYFPI